MDGGASENAACKKIGINRATSRSAVLKYNAADKYAQATAAMAKNQVDQIETVITEMRSGKIDPAVGRIEVDARKWIASKLWKPMWGDKVVAEVDHRHTFDLSVATDEQLIELERVQELLIAAPVPSES